MTSARWLYGLGVEVNEPFTALSALPFAPRTDVSIQVGRLPARVSDERFHGAANIYVSDEHAANGLPVARLAVLPDRSHYRFSYADGTRIAVDGAGARIWAENAPGASAEDTATYVLGPTFGFLLRLRGTTCLHASAVRIDGAAVAIVGDAGMGKSSTAAGFARLGHAVLTDDVAPLLERTDRFDVVPAYPRVRLWPDSAASLFGSADALPRITPTWDKRYLDLSGPEAGFQTEPLPLAAVYLLAERVPGNRARIYPMAARQALMALVAESYSRRCLEASQRADEFDVLSRLVSRVPVRCVHPRNDLARILELCDEIRRDYRGLRAERAA